MLAAVFRVRVVVYDAETGCRIGDVDDDAGVSGGQDSRPVLRLYRTVGEGGTGHFQWLRPRAAEEKLSSN